MMMPVDDSELRYMILKYISSKIDAGQIEPLIEGGLTPELLDALRNRKMRDIARVAQNSSIGFHFKIDNLGLTRVLRSVDALTRDQELLEYFVLHSAPAYLLNRLFPISNQDLRAMRAVLCRNKTDFGGRPNLPDTALRELIHAGWLEIQAGITDASEGKPERKEREQIYALSQRFPDYTIGTLWTVLKEFGDPRLLAKTSANRK